MTALALRQQHIHDLPRRVIAEQLPQRLLVPLDPVSLDKFKKMARLVQRQRRLREVRILRNEVGRRAMNVGEVASSATGDEDLPPRLRIVFEQQHATIALARDGRAHQPGRPGAQHDYIEFAYLIGHSFIVAERHDRSN